MTFATKTALLCLILLIALCAVFTTADPIPSEAGSTPPHSAPNTSPDDVNEDDVDLDLVLPPTPVAEPRVRTIRTHTPPSCPMRVLPNYKLTFTYTAHLITANNTVGEQFDQTENYQVMVLPANSRQMMPALLEGMLGMCVDETRMIIIPWQLQQYPEEAGVPPQTDTVFIVQLVDLSPGEDIFDVIDADFDNCITPSELTAYFGRVQTVLSSDGTHPLIDVAVPPALIPKAVEAYFAKYDKNGDGVLECVELGTAYKHCVGLGVCAVAEKERQRKLQEKLEQERQELLRKKAEEDRLRREKEEAEAAAAAAAAAERAANNTATSTTRA